MEETAETSSSTKEKMALLKPESNDSDDCEAGPSKRSKIDESIFKDVNISSIQNCLQSIVESEVEEYPIIKDCGNFITIYHGAKRRSFHVVNNFNFTREPTNVTIDESSIIIEKTVTKEVFPNDKEVIELIWKYLSFQDKTDCTLVCNRFNEIISNMNCSCLVLQFNSRLQIIPTVSRDYKKLVIQGYRCKSLSPAMHKMLKHLSQSVTNLTLDCCEFDFIALSKFLCEFPFLETLNLNVFIAKNSICVLSKKDLPNLKQLKDFHFKSKNKLNEILNITRSASNIESLTLFDAIFNENLIKYLTKNKNSLTTLSITKCIVEKPLFMTNLNSLYFGSNVKISPVNFKSFDCLNKLRKLELININNEVLGILKKKWVDQLEECTITFNYKQSFDVQRYFEGFYDHFIFQNIEYTEYFHTIYNNQQKYFIRCFERNKKMIEYFRPDYPNPSVDDINNNMIYFKITPITKTEDFLINDRNNSIIPSSLWQDILNAQAEEEEENRNNNYEWWKYDDDWKKEYDEWSLWDEEWCIEYYFLYRENDEWWNYDNECEKVYSKYYEKYNKLWDEYDLLKDYEDWCTRNQEWNDEYYKCYKRDDLWWEDCDDWIEEYLEWWEGDQEWKKQYYKCYKRKYEWWEICEDWQDEYDEWVDGYHGWCEEYYDWYREYYNYNKEYEDLSESREAKFWYIDHDNWYREYRKYKKSYEKWCEMGNKQRRNYKDRIRRFNDNVVEYYEWCDEDHEENRYNETSWRRYNTYDKEYDEWCDEYGELFLEDNKWYDMDRGWYDKDYWYEEDDEDYRFEKKEKYKYVV